MTDPTGKDLLDEQMDQRLQDAGARWRDTLPEPAPAVPVAAPAPRRRLVPVAAAAAVVVLLGVTYAVTSTGKDSAGPATDSPTPSVASDDTCGPGDLAATDRLLKEVPGLAILTVHLAPGPEGSSCLTNAFPEVTLLDHGEVEDVPTTHLGLDPGGTTVIAHDSPAIVQLVWKVSSRDCLSVDNDEVRIRVGGAEVSVEGFGPVCFAGGRAPVLRVDPLGQVIPRDTSHDRPVTGTVTLDGGPAGTSTPVTSGVVEVVNRSTGAGAQIGPDGTFELELPPGRFQVTAYAPQWNDGEPYRDGAFVVRSGTTNHLDIHIPIR